MSRPFVILSVGSPLEPEPLRTRGLILRQKGYVVASVDNIDTTLALFTHRDFHFDLLMLSHTIPFAERNRLAEMCKQSHPSARIMVLVAYKDCDPLADGCIDPQEGPQALLETVAWLLKKEAHKERRQERPGLGKRSSGGGHRSPGE